MEVMDKGIWLLIDMPIDSFHSHLPADHSSRALAPFGYLRTHTHASNGLHAHVESKGVPQMLGGRGSE